MWAMIAAAAYVALSGASKAMSEAANEKFRLQQEAQKAKHQANMSRMSAGTTAYERDLAMRSIENQALSQGLADGIAMSQNVVAQSNSGVALASKSKHMSLSSQRLMHVINQSNMELNRVNTLGNIEAKKVGFMGDALIHNANAKTNTILADQINVQEAGLNSLIEQGAKNYLQYKTMGGYSGGGGGGNFGVGGSGGGGGMGGGA